MRELLDGDLRRARAHRRSSPRSAGDHEPPLDGEPLALEAGILRVADALDMAKGRSRIPFEAGSVSMHSLSAAAIDEVIDRRRRDERP
jgi:metal-dependent HD superfamily phosphatase/phosphodiesterase